VSASIGGSIVFLTAEQGGFTQSKAKKYSGVNRNFFLLPWFSLRASASICGSIVLESFLTADKCGFTPRKTKIYLG
jgi:hypothetical protein